MIHINFYIVNIKPTVNIRWLVFLCRKTGGVMNKRLLESYQANKRLIERNKKKIEEEQHKDIPVVMGKVKGSAHDFPYIEQRFSVQMDEPVEADRAYRRILKWQQEIEQAEKEMEEVERFIESILNVEDREILRMYYMYEDERKTQKEIAVIFNCERSNIAKKISKYV